MAIQFLRISLAASDRNYSSGVGVGSGSDGVGVGSGSGVGSIATPIHSVIVVPASTDSPASGVCETTKPIFGSSGSMGQSSVGATINPLPASVAAATAGDSPIIDGISMAAGPVDT